MEWKNLPSTIKYSRKNIEKELLEYIKSLSLSLEMHYSKGQYRQSQPWSNWTKKNSAMRPKVVVMQMEMAGFDRYSNQSLTTNGIRYLLYLRFSLCYGYVTSFCTTKYELQRYLIFDSLTVQLNYEKFKIRNLIILLSQYKNFFNVFLRLILILFLIFF